MNLRSIARVCIAIASVILALYVAELYLRIANPIEVTRLNLHTEFSRTSDETIYEPIPNVSHNSAGLKNDREYSVKKPDKTFRIALIGDSLASGLELESKDRFATRLEAMLQASYSGSIRVEVLNFAVPGYNISQSISHFRKQGITYSPDLVIYWYWLDDAFVSDPGWASSIENPILRMLTYPSEGKHAFSLDSRIIGYLYELQLIRHLIFQLRANTERNLIQSKSDIYKAQLTPEIESLYREFVDKYTSQKIKDLDCCDTYFKAYTDSSNFMYVNYYMKEYSALCTSHSFSCMVLMSPVLYEHKKNEYNWKTLHSVISQISKVYNLSVLDSTALFDDYPHAQVALHSDDSEHPNALGNQIIANQVFEYIQKENILKQLLP